MRFPTKPSQLPTTMGIFRISFVTARIVSRVSADVSLPLTTSTNFIICAGEKKCIPAQNCLRLGDREEEIASTSKVDVLLNNRASSFLTMVSSLEKISRFTPRFSNTASTTRSQPARLERAVEDLRRANAAFSLEGDKRPFLVSTCNVCWMYFTPASRPLGFTSNKITGPYPAFRNDIAIPRPIVPAPITPIVPLPFASGLVDFFFPLDEDRSAKKI
mmetsp:Transcript_25593/g.36516  ORF Transcript_25593/g.36516 Transcript_25593/m.36516 type:complete len:217 (-) Transcript_25593:46-696(-)